MASRDRWALPLLAVRIGEADAVQRLELLPKVLFQRGAVGDVRAIVVFQPLEPAEEAVFDAVLAKDRARGFNLRVVGGL